jgi:hypothetical protein
VTKVEPKVDAAPAPVPMPASAPIPEPEPVPVPFPDPKIEIPCVAADLSRLLGNDDNAALIEAINKLTAEVARLNAKLARLAD